MFAVSWQYILIGAIADDQWMLLSTLLTQYVSSGRTFWMMVPAGIGSGAAGGADEGGYCRPFAATMVQVSPEHW